MRAIALLFACLVSVSSPAKADVFSEVDAALEVDDFAKAESLLEAAALAGNGEASFRLGRVAKEGVGVRYKTSEHASEWFVRSVNQGYTPTLVFLGSELWKGGKREFGLLYVQLAASLGDNEARHILSELPKTHPDMAAAREPLPSPEILVQRILASSNPAGTPTAQPAVLAKTCRGSVGKGLKAYNAGEYEDALCYWLPKAAAGDATAKNHIGLLFENGLTSATPKSDTRAAEYYVAAAQAGDTTAMRNLSRVQLRLGHAEAAQSWATLADQSDAQQLQARQQVQALGAYILLCALTKSCGQTRAPAWQPQSTASRQASTVVRPYNWSGPSPTQGFNRVSPTPMQSFNPIPSTSSRVTMCPNGSYVSGGSCRMAPNGSYISGSPRMAPDGSYVSGTPKMAPDGSYVGGSTATMCPDGSYVGGRRCILAPNGKYVGGN